MWGRRSLVSEHRQQSVSYVLLWQPSDCVHLFVIDCVVLFSENKYDDDDDDDDDDVSECGLGLA